MTSLRGREWGLKLVALAALLTAACGDTSSYGQLDAPSSGAGGMPPSPDQDPPDASASGAGAGMTGNCLAGDAPPCVDFLVSKTSDFGAYAFKSSWLLSGCREKEGQSCVTIPGECPNQQAPAEEQGARTLETFALGGTKGQHYKVTFTFNAIVEAKAYEAGTRDEDFSNHVESSTTDSFYRDGRPVPSGANVWRLMVLDDTGLEARHFYLNSFPAGPGFESNQTFLVSYTKSIVIVGRGKLTLMVQDPDCRSVDNCGAGPVPDDICAAPRTIPNEANVQLPAMYEDPADGQVKLTASLNLLSNGSTAQPWHSQAGHLTVLRIEETADPVTMNYP